MGHRLTAILAMAAVLVLAGCTSDAQHRSRPTASSSIAASHTTPKGPRPRSVAACLRRAGLKASEQSDTPAPGEISELFVTDQKSGGASVVFFSGPHAASIYYDRMKRSVVPTGGDANLAGTVVASSVSNDDRILSRVGPCLTAK